MCPYKFQSRVLLKQIIPCFNMIFIRWIFRMQIHMVLRMRTIIGFAKSHLIQELEFGSPLCPINGMPFCTRKLNMGASLGSSSITNFPISSRRSMPMFFQILTARAPFEWDSFKSAIVFSAQALFIQPLNRKGSCYFHLIREIFQMKQGKFLLFSHWQTEWPVVNNI